jgi:hypothetical protein
MPGRNFLRFAAHRTGNCLPKKFAGAELAGQAGVHFIQCRNLRMGFGTRRAAVDLDPAIPCRHCGNACRARITGRRAWLSDLGFCAGTEQSEMPNVTFFSEVPAARGPNFDDSAENKTVKLTERTEHPFLMAGKLQRTSDRQGLRLRRVLQEKGTVSGTRTGFHQGSRQDEQNPFLAASGREAPRWPDGGRSGEALLLKGR